MIRITLQPIVCNWPTLEVSVSEAVITLQGDDFDLSPMENGDIVPQDAITSAYIADDVRMSDGTIEISLLFPIRYNAPDVARFPDPILVTADGPVTLPANGD